MMHGVLQEQGGRFELRFERAFDVAPERVFAAISEADGLAQWYPTTVEGERKPGAALALVFTGDDGPPLTGTVVEFQPPSIFAFDEGDNRLRFTVSGKDSGSILSFVHGFPDASGAARAAAGWHVCLEVLAQYLAGGGMAVNREERFAELHGDYISRFKA